jgi:hypothetical protein
MFIANGDNTWTVRFYVGSTADYVTVDRLLPAKANGQFVYANESRGSAADPANELWLPLAEKAYAQWNETGKAGRDGTNTYDGLAVGWTGTVLSQVLGRSPSSYSYAAANKMVLIDAIRANRAVTTGTYSTVVAGSGLIGFHAYTVVGYDSSTDTFQLHNPHGVNHPGPLTWDQLKPNCGYFAVADTSGTAPLNAASTAGESSRMALLTGASTTAAPNMVLPSGSSNLLEIQATPTAGRKQEAPVRREAPRESDAAIRGCPQAVDACFHDLDRGWPWPVRGRDRLRGQPPITWATAAADAMLPQDT